MDALKFKNSNVISNRECLYICRKVLLNKSSEKKIVCQIFAFASANEILLNRALLYITGARECEAKNIQTLLSLFLNSVSYLPAACVPIVGIRRGIASPGLVKTFCFRVSHSVSLGVALRRGRYAAFWSCRRRFRAGGFRLVVRCPSESLRQKWILGSKNSWRAYFSVLYPTNPEGRDIVFSLAKFVSPAVRVGNKNVDSLQMTGSSRESQ